MANQPLLQPLLLPGLPAEVGRLSVLRLDQIGEGASGNKLFKLKYNLLAARRAGYDRLLSFGGAYSNHIHALAMAGRDQGMGTVGVIRGDVGTPLNPCLQDAVAAGMELHFISRSDYRRRHEPQWLAAWQQRFSDCFVIPEGGSNRLAVQGCREIADWLPGDCDTVLLPVGTGATMAGIACARPDLRVIGVSVLKNARYLEREVQCLIHDSGAKDNGNWSIEHRFHGGGYARLDRDLAQSLWQLQQHSELPLEPIYSGKALWALQQLMVRRELAAGFNQHIVFIHTGGLQGLRGMQHRWQQLLVMPTVPEHRYC